MKRYTRDPLAFARPPAFGWCALLFAAVMLAMAALIGAAAAQTFASYAEWEKAYAKAEAKLKECEDNKAKFEIALAAVKAKNEQQILLIPEDTKPIEQGLAAWQRCLDQAQRDLDLLKKRMPPLPAAGVEPDDDRAPRWSEDDAQKASDDYKSAGQKLYEQTKALNDAAGDVDEIRKSQGK